MKLESEFQAKLIKEIEKLLPGAMVFKTDPPYQGFPDILILFENKWATLECKRGANSKKQPNQEYYVDRLNNMSFSRFIYPENKEEVLHDLQQALGSNGATCLSRSK